MFKNPNFVEPIKVRYEQAKPFIDQFVAELSTEKKEFSFDDFRQFFANHKNAAVRAKAAGLTDGEIDHYLQKHGIERS